MKFQENKDVCICFWSMNWKLLQLFPISRKRKGSFLQPWGNVFWSRPVKSFSTACLAGASSSNSRVSGHSFSGTWNPTCHPKTRAERSTLQRKRNQFWEYDANLANLVLLVSLSANSCWVTCSGAAGRVRGQESLPAAPPGATRWCCSPGRGFAGLLCLSFSWARFIKQGIYGDNSEFFVYICCG